MEVRLLLTKKGRLSSQLKKPREKSICITGRHVHAATAALIPYYGDYCKIRNKFLNMILKSMLRFGCSLLVENTLDDMPTSFPGPFPLAGGGPPPAHPQLGEKALGTRLMTCELHASDDAQVAGGVGPSWNRVLFHWCLVHVPNRSFTYNLENAFVQCIRKDSSVHRTEEQQCLVELWWQISVSFNETSV